MAGLKPKKIIVIPGPTASGKTAISIEIARHFNWPILSFDARQFYREMSIGTAVPSFDELQSAEHHFIQSYSIHHSISAGDYARYCKEIIQNHPSDVLILTGGSGLYLQAVLFGFDELPPISDELRAELRQQWNEKGLTWLQSEVSKHDPEHFKSMDQKNPQRLLRVLELCISSGKAYSEIIEKDKSAQYSYISLAPDWPRELLYARINQRVDEMLKKGLLQEVQELLPYRDLTALKTVGYSELFEYLGGKRSLADAVELIKRNSRRYAKRQLTWFRHQLPDTEWIDGRDHQAFIQRIERIWVS